MNLSSIPFAEIVKKAFLTAWKNRFLWWFGFFIILGGSGTQMNPGLDEGQSKQLSDMTFPVIENFMHILLIAGLLIFLVFIGLFILSMLGRASMVASLHALENKEEIGFKEGFRRGKPFLWKILGVHVVLSLAIIAVFVILFGPTLFFFINENWVAGSIVAIIAVLIFLPIIIGAILTQTFSIFYVVLGKLPVFSAIENGYLLLKKNLAATIVMLLIVFGVRIVATMIIMMVLVILGAPLFVGSILLFSALEGLASILGFIATALIMMPIVLIVASALETLFQALWFQYFHAIARKNKPSLANASKNTVKSPTETLSPATNSTRK